MTNRSREATLWMECPRDVNEVIGLVEFIEVWDHPQVFGPAKRYEYKASDSGHINESGRSDTPNSPAIPYWHPQFSGALEPGVATLVMVLTCGGRWISYTSCEGHYDSTHPESSCERHVGLLPRTEEEREDIVQRLSAANEAIPNERYSAVGIRLATSTISAGRSRYHGLELYLARSFGSSWEDYFRQLDGATSALLASLDACL